ncbi:MAG: hypothetical protein AAF721_10060 [Myxococcota bacterium]
MFGSTGERPSIRAGWTRGVLRYYEAHREEALVAQTLERVADESLRAIRALDDLEWLAIEPHVELLEALLADLGPAEFVALYRRASVALMRSRLLRTTAVAGVRVFGRKAILRVLPRAWRLVVRDCGQFRVGAHPTKNCAVVTLSSMPPVIAQSQATKLCIAAMLAGACDLGGYPGRVRIAPAPAGARTFVFEVSLYGEPEYRRDQPGPPVDLGD